MANHTKPTKEDMVKVIRSLNPDARQRIVNALARYIREQRKRKAALAEIRKI